MRNIILIAGLIFSHLAFAADQAVVTSPFSNASSVERKPIMVQHKAVHHVAANDQHYGGEYYTNVSGHRIHRPMHASSRPAGATAHCRDGSWSFSEHSRGTCSHHGGVGY